MLNHTIEITRIKQKIQLFKEFLLSEPKECTVKSKENMDADVRVYRIK